MIGTRKPFRLLTAAVLNACLLINSHAVAETPESPAPRHGIAMHGDLKYPADFDHFDYTNPDAPKGGILKQWSLGTFDSFNPFIIKGTPEDNIGMIYDSLMTKSDDEPLFRVRTAGRVGAVAGRSALGRLQAAPGGALQRR